MTVYVVVGGQSYSGFLSMNFSRSLESLCGVMSITCSAVPGKPFPIKRSQPCKVYINDFPLFNGYIETLEVHYSPNEHHIVLSCRDKTCDIVDSSLIGAKEFNTPITLQAVAENVLAANGLEDIVVLDQTNGVEPFDAGDIVAAEVSQTIFEFLEKYCRKRQVFMTTDENGDLCFIRAGTVDSGGKILNVIGGKDNNVLSSNVCFKETERFNTYIVHSQTNTTARTARAIRNRVKTVVGRNRRELNSHISAQSGQATDDEVRTSRVKEIISETASNIQDCTNQAIWYANVYRARSAEYRATLQGFFLPSGDLWRLNELVFVQDDFCNINATMLIKDIKYDYSVTGGSTVELTLVTKDAFTLQAMIDAQTKKNNNIGNDLTDDVNAPDEDESPTNGSK